MLTFKLLSPLSALLGLHRDLVLSGPTAHYNQYADTPTGAAIVKEA